MITETGKVWLLELANWFERVGNGPPAMVPELRQCCTTANALRQIAEGVNPKDDLEEWYAAVGRGTDDGSTAA